MSKGVTTANYFDVFDQLERARARYVVTGGVAVVLHGYIRPIADLDMVIDPAPDEARRALNALAATGFIPSVPLPTSAVTVLRLFDHTGREVDVFFRYHIPFEELWQDSQRVSIGDRFVRVLSLEHLLRRKRLYSRPQDIQDIEGLLALSKEGS